MAEIVRTMVDEKANLRTDESVIYKTVGQEFASHKRVKHALGQYVRYDPAPPYLRRSSQQLR